MIKAACLATDALCCLGLRIGGALQVYLDPLAEPLMLRLTGWGDGGEWDKTYACFNRARGGVLATLKKHFDSGPQDWTGRREQLSKIHAEAKRKPAAVR